MLATVISTVIGTLMALALVRYEFFGRRAANFLIVIPMATPEVVMGSALLSFFLLIGTFSLGFETLLIAHVMFCISFVVVVVRSRLIGFDRNLEEAAKDLGASAFETFRLVTLPLIMPGIFGAAMLAFALSIDDFVISNFNSGTTVTFPLYIFGAAQRGIPVEVNVIAMILFFFTVAAMGFATWQQRRAEKMASVRPEQEAGDGRSGRRGGGDLEQATRRRSRRSDLALPQQPHRRHAIGKSISSAKAAYGSVHISGTTSCGGQACLPRAANVSQHASFTSSIPSIRSRQMMRSIRSRKRSLSPLGKRSVTAWSFWAIW